MEQLRNLLDTYRNRGLFPSFCELSLVQAESGDSQLAKMLAEYQEGAQLPAYCQLARLAYF